jgi:hypothetical protein
MTIEYQSTFAEYEEACKAVGKFLAKERKKGILVRFVPIALVVYAVVAIIFWYSFGREDHSVVLFHLFVPVILCGILIPIVVVMMNLLAGKWPRFSAQAWIVIGLIACISGAFIGLMMLSRAAVTQPRPPPWTIDVLLPHTMWLGVVVMVAMLTVRQSANEIRDHWERHPTLNRRKSVEITAEGVQIRDDVSEDHYRWEAFAGFAETKNLFVLMTSLRTAQYFPKRAFANQEEINAMRAMAEMIHRRTNRAFPIQPVPAPAPLGERAG